MNNKVMFFDFKKKQREKMEEAGEIKDIDAVLDLMGERAGIDVSHNTDSEQDVLDSAPSVELDVKPLEDTRHDVANPEVSVDTSATYDGERLSSQKAANYEDDEALKGNESKPSESPSVEIGKDHQLVPQPLPLNASNKQSKPVAVYIVLIALSGVTAFVGNEYYELDAKFNAQQQDIAKVLNLQSQLSEIKSETMGQVDGYISDIDMRVSAIEFENTNSHDKNEDLKNSIIEYVDNSSDRLAGEFEKKHDKLDSKLSSSDDTLASMLGSLSDISAQVTSLESATTEGHDEYALSIKAELKALSDKNIELSQGLDAQNDVLSTIESTYLSKFDDVKSSVELLSNKQGDLAKTLESNILESVMVEIKKDSSLNTKELHSIKAALDNSDLKYSELEKEFDAMGGSLQKLIDAQPPVSSEKVPEGNAINITIPSDKDVSENDKLDIKKVTSPTKAKGLNGLGEYKVILSTNESALVSFKMGDYAMNEVLRLGDVLNERVIHKIEDGIIIFE